MCDTGPQQVTFIRRATSRGGRALLPNASSSRSIRRRAPLARGSAARLLIEILCWSRVQQDPRSIDTSAVDYFRLFSIINRAALFDFDHCEIGKDALLQIGLALTPAARF
jgi:hypothetical protein